MNGIHTAFQGTVGSEAELKYTQTGKATLGFSVAVSQNRSNGDGAEVQWLRATVWETEAERLAELLYKGSEVYIEGTLKLNVYTDKAGVQQTALNVSSRKCELLGAIGKQAQKSKPLDTVKAARRLDAALEEELLMEFSIE